MVRTELGQSSDKSLDILGVQGSNVSRPLGDMHLRL